MIHGQHFPGCAGHWPLLFPLGIFWMSLGIKVWDALERAQTHHVSYLPHSGTDRAAGKSHFSHRVEKSLLKSQTPYSHFKWLVHFEGTSWVLNGWGWGKKKKKLCGVVWKTEN